MPQPESQFSAQIPDHPTSEAQPAQETLFLLSISRDEDDAAALRADLKRSALGRYKIQHCAHIDDANHLLQVCGFDLVFLRLDDFRDKQAAVDLVRQSDPDLSIVALATSRLLASPGFYRPAGIDAVCRVEDLSPTLVATLVSSVIEQKRSQQETRRLSQELNFARSAGELGSWTLDIETGRLALCEKTSKLLALPRSAFLDDLLEKVYPVDQDRLKRIIDLAIETQGDLQTNFRLARASPPAANLELSAKFRPGSPRSNPTLYGFLKQEARSSDDIQARIEAANAAIRKALSLRDDAIETASKELELLLQKLSVIESSDAESPPAQEAMRPKPAPQPSSTVPSAPPAKEILPPLPQAGNPPPTAAPTIPAPGKAIGAADPDALGIDKKSALQNVLKSITRQKKDLGDNTFPFDFSTEQAADYSEPSLQRDGFLGAAKRLVSITKNGHQLDVTLSIDSDGAIECEREKVLLFEILRELLTNVVKHARASECIIALFRDEDDWVLQIEDDGVGLENNLVSISTPLNKIGLFRVRTKLALKGGQLDLTPAYPKGLIARARLPVSLSSRDAEHA